MTRSRSPRTVALVALLALLLVGCGGDDDASTAGDEPAAASTSAAPQLKEGGSVRYAADQEPPGFNINTSKDNGTSVQNIVVSVWPSAFVGKPDFTVEVDKTLLTSAELTSSDPQTVVYEIRPEASWSDGTPIAADDFIYAWESQRGTDKEIDAAGTAGYEDIASVVGSNGGKTVTATFSKPFSDWPALFTNIVPAHFTKALPGGWNTGLDDVPAISGGPFVIDSWAKGQSLTLKRNEAYWGPRAKLDSIVFVFLPDSASQPPALKNSEVDLIYPQPQTDLVEQVRALPTVKSEVNFGLSFEHLTFNTAAEHLKDVRVRRAIAKALDRDALVERTVAQFDPAAERLDNRIWLTGQPEYEPHGEEYAEQDTAGAAALLQTAGYAKGADGVFAKGGKRLSLRLSTTAGNSLREQQGVLIQAQLRDAGIEIRIENTESTTLFGDWLPNGRFDIGNWGWVGSPFTISGSKNLFSTGSGSNFGLFSDAEVDRMFLEANAELDKAKAAAIGNRIDERLWEQMASVPLYQKPTFIAYRSDLRNVGDNATSVGPFWNARTWAFGKQAA